MDPPPRHHHQRAAAADGGLASSHSAGITTPGKRQRRGGGNGRGQRGGRGARGISDKIRPERGKGPPGISLFPATGRAQTRRGAAGRRARRIAAREDNRNDRRGDDSAREEARRATETRARGARTGGEARRTRGSLHGERSGSVAGMKRTRRPHRGRSRRDPCRDGSTAAAPDTARLAIDMQREADIVVVRVWRNAGTARRGRPKT